MARILLVDDDEDILKMGQRLLIKHDHDVILVKNGIQALEYLEKFSFDMVISDANMPQMSGFELLLKIKNNPQWKDMAVALLTGRKTKNDVERALRLGVDDYIVKPIDPIIFLEKVNQLLTKKEPTHWPEVEISPGDNWSQARIEIDLKIVSISEFGINFLSHLCPHEGTILYVNAPLFKEIQVESPLVKIMSVQQTNKPSEWLIKTHYMGVKDNFLQQVRSWMYQNLLKKAG